MRFKRITENNTLIPGVLQALEYIPGVFAFRVANEAARRRRHSSTPGIADILGLHNGLPFAIETKASHGANCGRKACSCAEQRLWRAEWCRAGGRYILATTVQQAVDALTGRKS